MHHSAARQREDSSSCHAQVDSNCRVVSSAPKFWTPVLINPVYQRHHGQRSCTQASTVQHQEKILTILQRVEMEEFAQEVSASCKLTQRGCDETFTFQPKRSKPSPSWQAKWLQLAVQTRAWVRTFSHFSPLFCQALMLHRQHKPSPGTQTPGTAKLRTMRSEGPMGISRKFTNNS